MSSFRVAVLTVSDRCARGEREDKGGPAVVEAIRALGWRVVDTAVVADDVEAIRRRLTQWSDGADRADLVLTTGGTGLAARDVTPEATLGVADKQVPGLPEKMRREGEKAQALAPLSRAVCVVRKKTLMLNLPGSPRGAVESLDAVSELLIHALQVVRGEERHHEHVRRDA